MKPFVRPLFLTDMEEIADCLFTEADTQVAEKFRAALKRTVATISNHPDIGRIRSDLPMSSIRTFIVKGFANWLVFYRCEKERLELLRLKHGMMHLPELFESGHSVD
jgi:plasmid stabilization system protein ParE